MEIGRSSTRSQNIGPQSKPFFLLSFPKGQIGRFSIRSQYHRGSRIQAISLELLEQRKIGRSSMGCQLSRSRIQQPFVVSSCANSGKIGGVLNGVPTSRSRIQELFIPSICSKSSNRTVMNRVPIANSTSGPGCSWDLAGITAYYRLCASFA
jgi:hypothetical protein